MAIFRDFRRIADALERLASTATQLRENAPALDRLEALELSRAQFEADVEGMLMKAESKLKAAANSEARERHLRKRNEEAQDAFALDGDQDGRPPGPGIPIGDVEPGGEEGMLPVHLGLETADKKALILRMKFA